MWLQWFLKVEEGGRGESKREVTTEEVRVIKNQKESLTFVGFENEEKSQEPRNVSSL